MLDLVVCAGCVCLFGCWCFSVVLRVGSLCLAYCGLCLFGLGFEVLVSHVDCLLS